MMSGIEVECYAGYRGEEYPLRFVIHGRELLVAQVLEQWREPSARYFKVKASDGRDYLLRQDLSSGVWQEAGRT
jgi:hypothetical protein